MASLLPVASHTGRLASRASRFWHPALRSLDGAFCQHAPGLLQLLRYLLLGARLPHGEVVNPGESHELRISEREPQLCAIAVHQSRFLLYTTDIALLSN